MARISRSIKLFICITLLIPLFYQVIPAEAKSQVHHYPRLSRSMGKEINSYLRKVRGDVTLEYHDLTSGEEYQIKGSSSRRAASTMKLPLVMYVMDLVSHRRLSLNQKLTYHRYEYYDGSGVIQYRRVGSRFTIRDLISKAVIYSDNIALIMLENRVGVANFHRYLKSIGGRYIYPSRGRIMTSSRDLTVYAKKLYQDAKRNANDRLLIYYLEHTKYNATIPAGIKHVRIAHKVGWMPDLRVSNDVAIVYDRHPYTLAIMTNGYSYAKSKGVIAHIAWIINKYHKMKYKEK